MKNIVIHLVLDGTVVRGAWVDKKTAHEYREAILADIGPSDLASRAFTEREVRVVESVLHGLPEESTWYVQLGHGAVLVRADTEEEARQLAGVADDPDNVQCIRKLPAIALVANDNGIEFYTTQ